MNSYTIVRIGAETYAIPVRDVIEIASLGDLTVVPGARKEVLGVRNLRRQILPVVDLAPALGVAATAPRRRLVVAEGGGITACLAVDEVSDVGELPDPAEETDSDVLLGAMLHEGELIGVVDVARVFARLAEPDRRTGERRRTG